MSIQLGLAYIRRSMGCHGIHPRQHLHKLFFLFKQNNLRDRGSCGLCQYVRDILGLHTTCTPCPSAIETWNPIFDTRRFLSRSIAIKNNLLIFLYLLNIETIYTQLHIFYIDSRFWVLRLHATNERVGKLLRVSWGGWGRDVLMVESTVATIKITLEVDAKQREEHCACKSINRGERRALSEQQNHKRKSSSQDTDCWLIFSVKYLKLNKHKWNSYWLQRSVSQLKIHCRSEQSIYLDRS